MNNKEATYDKEFLYSEVRAGLFKIRANKKAVQELGTILVNRVPMDMIILLLTNENYIYLNDEQVYWLAKILNQLSRKYDLEIDFSSDIDDFYTEQEVNSAENYLINQASPFQEETTVVIDNIEQIKLDVYYKTKATYGEIAHYYQSGTWIYNYETQRTPNIIKTGMGEVYQPKIYRKNIEEIKELMINREYDSDTITLNILQTGNEKFDFDGSKLILYRGKGSQINIIDGFHRTIAICKALEEDPSLADEIMYLQVLNFDIERAINHIRQKGKGTPIDYEGKKVLVNDNIHNTIQYLNNDRDSLLKNKVSGHEEEVFNMNTKYVLYNTLVEALEDFYPELKKIKMASAINNMSRHISKIISYVIKTHKEDFENIKESQEKQNIFTFNNMFVVYVWMANKLQQDEDWEWKVDEFLNTLNSNTSLITSNIQSKREDKAYRRELIKNMEKIWNKIFEEVRI